ncbi:TPA: restriction endonuclease subunit S [Streptococcus suis]
MSEVEFISLVDSGIEILDGDRGKNYPAKSDLAKHGDCVFLNTGNVKNNGFDFSDVDFISFEKDFSLRNGKLLREDIVMTTRGTVGNLAYYSKDIRFNHIRINSGMVIIRVNQENWIPYFIYLFLQSDLFKKQTQKLISGSAQPQLPISVLETIRIPNYSMKQQEFIAIQIQAIDQKIALNNQINEELEAMAKTLYDYWFVQFDFPDENGNPYKSSGGKMVYNDQLKREIPEGWGVENLSNFLTIKNGKDHKDLSDGNYPVYGSGGLMRKVEDYIFEGESVLIPRKGTLNNIIYVDEKFWTVDTMFYTHMKIDYVALYTYFSIKDIDFTKLNTGTGVPSMTASILYQLQIINPNADVLKNFDELVRTTYRMIFDNRKQNQELNQLREWLLPMLMNGQVKVD